MKIYKLLFALIIIFFNSYSFGQSNELKNKYSEKEIILAESFTANGDRLGALKKLRQITNSVRFNDTLNIHILCDVFVSLSECYAESFMMEKFKKASDTLLLISMSDKVDIKYKIRAYLNLVRYYNYQVLGDRARPYLDSATILISNKKEKQDEFNDPILLIAKIGFSRNFDAYTLPSLIDSIQNIINKKGYKNKLIECNLWRVMGNAFFDKCSAAQDWKINRINGWYEKAMYCYNKAEEVLKKISPIK